MTIDTGPAKLPGLPVLRTDDPAIGRWAQAVAEHLEVRAGARGNPMERTVTQRELTEIKTVMQYLSGDGRVAQPGDVVVQFGGGLSATMAIDKFVTALKGTRLYQDLMLRLDDPRRFNDLPQEVREALLRSIADEAAARGADVRRLENKIQTSVQSLATTMQEVTASVEGSAAGVRQLTYASAMRDRAQAGQVLQLEASLGNFYQDGGVGRANLEQQFGVVADRVTGLRAQYTLKVMAGGALAGYGISAEEVNGVPSSAFIIAANRFAIVDPATYTGGLTNTPDTAHVPFGVDASGIYLNNNVYVRGTLRVDTTGKKLSDGLRGSLQVGVDGTVWNDNVARQAIWTALGYSGLASNNNHLVVGDSVTIFRTGVFSQTRFWFGSDWRVAGVVLSGDVLVDGSVAAQKIDTRGLTIKDANGKIVFSAGTGLDANLLSVGSNFSAVATSDFSGTAGGYTAMGATIETGTNSIILASTSNDPQFLSAAFEVPGKGLDKVRMRVKRIAGSGWDGTLYYATTSHPFSVNFYKQTPSDPTVLGQYTVIEWDMERLTLGGADWTNGLITRLRFDLGASPADVFEIDWLAIGRNTPVSASDLDPTLVRALNPITAANIGTYIASAAIGTAYIGDLAVTAAKIQDLSVTTLKIGDGQVTSLNYADAGASSHAAGEVALKLTVSVFNMPANSSGVVISGTAVCQAVGSNASLALRIVRMRDGASLGFTACSFAGGFSSTFNVNAFDPAPAAGTNSYGLYVENPTTGPGSNVAFQVMLASATAAGGKR